MSFLKPSHTTIIDLLSNFMPMDKLEAMVRADGPKALTGLMAALHATYGLAPDERMGFIAVQAEKDGAPTVVLMPVAYTADLAGMRRLPYYDLCALLAKAPVQYGIEQALHALKVTEKVEKLHAEVRKDKAAGKLARAERKLDAAQALLDTVPAWLRGLGNREAQLAQLEAQQPELPPQPFRLRLNAAPEDAPPQEDAPPPEDHATPAPEEPPAAEQSTDNSAPTPP